MDNDKSPHMDTIFDLEQSILSTWRITDDLRDVVSAARDQNLTSDQLINMMTTLADLYDYKFERSFSNLSKAIESKQIWKCISANMQIGSVRIK